MHSDFPPCGDETVDDAELGVALVVGFAVVDVSGGKYDTDVVDGVVGGR